MIMLRITNISVYLHCLHFVLGAVQIFFDQLHNFSIVCLFTKLLQDIREKSQCFVNLLCLNAGLRCYLSLISKRLLKTDSSKKMHSIGMAPYFISH